MEFLEAAWLGKPLWMWAGFLAIVLALLVFDLGVLNRRDREMGIAESLRLSAFYIGFAMLFGAGIWWGYEAGLLTTSDGTHAGVAFFTGFFIEKALSIDNVFVISLIFGYFAIPARVSVSRAGVGHHRRHRAARHHDRRGRGAGAGICLGALHLRRLPDRHRHQDAGGAGRRAGHLAEPGRALPAPAHAGDGRAARPELLRAPARPGDRQDARFATPLFLALVVINIADLIFAVDSVPAIFAITTDTFIVYTANIMAILGLRALYFALAAMVHRFHYLKYALALVLVFIGVKIFWNQIVGKLDPAISLGVTLALIAGGVLWSLWKTRKDTVAVG